MNARTPGRQDARTPERYSADECDTFYHINTNILFIVTLYRYSLSPPFSSLVFSFAFGKFLQCLLSHEHQAVVQCAKDWLSLPDDDGGRTRSPTKEEELEYLLTKAEATRDPQSSCFCMCSILNSEINTLNLQQNKNVGERRSQFHLRYETSQPWNEYPSWSFARVNAIIRKQLIEQRFTFCEQLMEQGIGPLLCQWMEKYGYPSQAVGSTYGIEEAFLLKQWQLNARVVEDTLKTIHAIMFLLRKTTNEAKRRLFYQKVLGELFTIKKLPVTDFNERVYGRKTGISSGIDVVALMLNVHGRRSFEVAELCVKVLRLYNENGTQGKNIPHGPMKNIEGLEYLLVVLINLCNDSIDENRNSNFENDLIDGAKYQPDEFIAARYKWFYNSRKTFCCQVFHQSASWNPLAQDKKSVTDPFVAFNALQGATTIRCCKTCAQHNMQSGVWGKKTLIYYETPWTISCDGCKKNYKRGTRMYGCDGCDHDICLNCIKKFESSDTKKLKGAQKELNTAIATVKNIERKRNTVSQKTFDLIVTELTNALNKRNGDEQVIKRETKKKRFKYVPSDSRISKTLELSKFEASEQHAEAVELSRLADTILEKATVVLTLIEMAEEHVLAKAASEEARKRCIEILQSRRHDEQQLKKMKKAASPNRPENPCNRDKDWLEKHNKNNRDKITAATARQTKENAASKVKRATAAMVAAKAAAAKVDKEVEEAIKAAEEAKVKAIIGHTSTGLNLLRASSLTTSVLSTTINCSVTASDVILEACSVLHTEGETKERQAHASNELIKNIKASLPQHKPEFVDQIEKVWGSDGIAMYNFAMYTKGEWGIPWWDDADWKKERDWKKEERSWNSPLSAHGMKFSMVEEDNSKDATTAGETKEAGKKSLEGLLSMHAKRTKRRLTSLNVTKLLEEYNKEAEAHEKTRQTHPTLCLPPSTMTFEYLRELKIGGFKCVSGGRNNFNNLNNFNRKQMTQNFSDHLLELPDSMFVTLFRIESLIMYNVSLVRFPESMFTLPFLKTLGITHVQIEQSCNMASNWPLLSNLTVEVAPKHDYDISREFVFPKSFFKSLKNSTLLQKIQIYYQRLSDYDYDDYELPAEMFENKTQLYDIDICKNVIMLPLHELHLPSLRNMRCSNREFDDIDGGGKQVGTFTALEKLDLGCADFSRESVLFVPRGLANLSLLKELTIKITDVRPDGEGDCVFGKGWIGMLPCLEKLDCQRSNMSSISEDIGRCTNLEKLDISYNKQLTYLPASLTKCCKLETLSVRGSSIQCWPDGAERGWYNLKNLNISDSVPNHALFNKEMITKIIGRTSSRSSVKFSGKHNLDKLIKEGKITEANNKTEHGLWEIVKKKWGKKPFEKYPTRILKDNTFICDDYKMFAKSGDFATIAEAIAISFPNLKQFHATGNSWDCRCGPKTKQFAFDLAPLSLLNCDALETINLKSNIGGWLNGAVLSRFTNLRSLNLSQCTLVSNTPLEKLEKLETLDLSSSKSINNINTIFGYPLASTVTDLNLSENSKCNLQFSSLSAFTSLKKLNLSQNTSMKSLDFLSSLQDTLEWLNIRRCNSSVFSTFPSNMGQQFVTLIASDLKIIFDVPFDKTKLGIRLGGSAFYEAKAAYENAQCQTTVNFLNLAPIACVHAHLEQLDLSSNLHLHDISLLSTMTNLRDLNLAQVGVPPNAMAVAVNDILIKCPNVIVDTRSCEGYEYTMSVEQIESKCALVIGKIPIYI